MLLSISFIAALCLIVICYTILKLNETRCKHTFSFLKENKTNTYSSNTFSNSDLPLRIEITRFFTCTKCGEEKTKKTFI